HHVAQLIAQSREREFLGGLAVTPAPEADDVETSLGELARQDRAGPAHADHDRIGFLQSRCHGPLPSRKIRDRLWFCHVALVAVGIDLVGIDRGETREADHLPGDLVAIAAVNRIGEEALHGDGEELMEECAGIKALELGLAVLHCCECLHALGDRKKIEILSIGLPRPGVGGGNSRREEFPRRERKLVTLLGLALMERAASIHFVTATPGAAATPQSLPEGESSSAGMSVSTAATVKAASGAVSVTNWSGSGAGAGTAAVGCCACAGAVGVRPAATAVLAPPNRKLRRAIGLLSSGALLSVMATPLRCRARASCSMRAACAARASPRGIHRVVLNKTNPIFTCARGASAATAFNQRFRIAGHKHSRSPRT